MRNLVAGEIKVPTADGKTETVSLRDLGVSYPVLINPGRIETEVIDNPNPIVAGQEGTGVARTGRPEMGREKYGAARQAPPAQVPLHRAVLLEADVGQRAARREEGKQIARRRGNGGMRSWTKSKSPWPN